METLLQVLRRTMMIVALAAAGMAIAAQSTLVDVAEAAVVSRIDVEGNQRVDDETIRAYVTIKPGRSFSAEDVDESLKALFETGLFADVRMARRTSVLVVTVVENPIIDKVAFEGNKKYKDIQLASAVRSRARGIYTQATVESDTQRLLEFYRRSGRFQASIEPQIINLSANRVVLVFVVNEGPETVVARINFIGNKRFSDGKLRDIIATRQSGLFGFLRRSDTYDPDRLAADEEKIRRFYLERGYADIQIISTVADLDIERNIFFVTITLDEGQRYKFGTIDVDSAIPGVDPERLRRKVTASEGAWYSSRRIEESLEAITIELAGSGYAFAQVRPRIDRDSVEGIINVVLIVDEGTRAYVERIEIRGNTRTRDYVIRREFEISEGDAFNRVLVDQAERRLRALGFFSDVRITVERGSSADRVTILVAVQEQQTGEFSFGAGYSTSDGVVGDISITERNFLGRGYRVKLAVGGGDSSRTYEFAASDPMFLGRPISAGFNVYRRDYEQNDFRRYSNLTTGGGFDLGFPITENLTFRVGYNIEQQEIDVAGWSPPLSGANPCPAGISIALCTAEGDVLISSASYSLTYDSLDDRSTPRDGIYARFSQKFAGVGGDVNYLRSEATASYYRTLLADQDVIGLLRVQGAHVMGLAGDDLRLTDHLFKGGESIRGFESSGIGPRDMVTGDALGGKIFFAGTAEVQFPIPVLPREIGVRGAVFADAGTLYDTDSGAIPGVTVQDSDMIRSSVGASILWASPLGPIRADWAYVLSSEDFDKEQSFRIGGQKNF